ncbi:hypothetical protein [Salmonella bongori]|uniref:Uncharacterized protein n=1 Tax=Salmonella bongori N268-08 TaxID=1197719 RepID=S5MWN3_SALBN|nr:hypothetical protein [Salmonella bongori]AGR59063.1 hypothetical protein A464_1878 [Salmonella bongori N268-08]MBA3226772.1 hypothetical protein [Salmonella bongori]
MQRLEQGDVVTEAQLARLTRPHSRFMCAGLDYVHPVTYVGMLLAIRHFAISLKPE